jgi:glycerol-3-phosphate dehydrogenase
MPKAESCSTALIGEITIKLKLQMIIGTEYGHVKKNIYAIAAGLHILGMAITFNRF